MHSCRKLTINSPAVSDLHQNRQYKGGNGKRSLVTGKIRVAPGGGDRRFYRALLGVNAHSALEPVINFSAERIFKALF